MRKLSILLALACLLLSQACARNYLSIRELPSDVARARCACHPQAVKKEIRIEKTIEGVSDARGEAAEMESLKRKVIKAHKGDEPAPCPCAAGRTQSTWLIFDYNGIETLYWCTPSHEMTEKPACVPVRYGGAAIFPEPGLKHLPLPKAASTAK